MKYALWIAQVLMAAAFLMAGASKFLMSAAEMQANMVVQLPIPFVRFIGACELLAVLGLILPGLLRIQPWLTPLAAALTLPIMIGAVGFTVYGMGVLPALFPLVVGCLGVFVAYGRWKVLPLRGR